MAQEDVFKKIVSHCKEYGYVFPSSDIYDGLGAVYDYGQMGVELKNNIKKYWWDSMAGGGDVILIPEIEYSIKNVGETIMNRLKKGKPYSIVVVAEGIKTGDGKRAAEYVAREIEHETGIETRQTVLGYIQRGGAPTPFDRNLSTRMGGHVRQDNNVRFAFAFYIYRRVKPARKEVYLCELVYKAVSFSVEVFRMHICKLLHCAFAAKSGDLFLKVE